MTMLGDGFSKRCAVMEKSFAYEVDRKLLEEAKSESRRQRELEEIQQATQITVQQILTELINCGVRANSLHILTLVPLVHVAWSNSHIERAERLAILKAAEQEGILADSPGYQELDGWLRKRPDAKLIKTWKDYVAAIRLFVAPETYEALRVTTIARARQVAESAGGFLGFHMVSRAEEAAIQELNAAFVQ